MFRVRLGFLQFLRERGYYVHMHAYEYVVGYGGRLTAVILLEPLRCRVEVYGVPGIDGGRLRVLAETIAEYFPGVEVDVIVRV